MKSKKAAPKKKVQQVDSAPIQQVQMPASNVNYQQAPQMSNAQQQQLYNYQQQQQPIPQMSPNVFMNNAQMQMNSNMNQAPQMNMQMPIQQIAPPMGNIGYYGRTRQPMDVEWPATFNDD